MTLLDRTVEASVLRSFVLVAVSLTALFSLFDFVDQLGDVGHGRYRLIDAVIFVMLTAPLRFLQVTPVAMLLGCLLSLGGFGRHAELIAMGSLGVSEGRIMMSAFRLVLPIVVVLFLLAEFVIPIAQRLAQEGRSSALASFATARGDDSFWAQSAGHYLNVQKFADGNVPENIDIYAFDADGDLARYIHADRADIRPDGAWQLADVEKTDVTGSVFRTEHFASLAWTSFMSAPQAELLILPPASMPPVALYRYVRHLRRTHQQATLYEQEIWSRISIPLSLVAMVMIAAPFVFGPPRTQSAGLQLMIGAAIGVVFSLVQQVTTRLDLLLDLGPGTLALAPSLLLMSLAAYLFLVLRR